MEGGRWNEEDEGREMEVEEERSRWSKNEGEREGIGGEDRGL